MPTIKKNNINKKRVKKQHTKKYKKSLKRSLKRKHNKQIKLTKKNKRQNKAKKNKKSKKILYGGNDGNVFAFKTTTAGSPNQLALENMKKNALYQNNINNGNHSLLKGGKLTVPSFSGGISSEGPNGTNILSQNGNSTHVQGIENRMYDKQLNSVINSNNR